MVELRIRKVAARVLCAQQPLERAWFPRRPRDDAEA
jgi:hypothetical protein